MHTEPDRRQALLGFCLLSLTAIVAGGAVGPRVELLPFPWAAGLLARRVVIVGLQDNVAAADHEPVVVGIAQELPRTGRHEREVPVGQIDTYPPCGTSGDVTADGYVDNNDLSLCEFSMDCSQDP